MKRYLTITILCCLLLTTLSSCKMFKDVESSMNGNSHKDNTLSEVSSNSGSSNSDPSTTPQSTAPVEVDPLEIVETTTFEEIYSYAVKCPDLTDIDASKVTLTSEQYLKLCDAVPNAKIVTSVEFEGFVMDLGLSEIDISGNVITDKESFDALLSHLPEGKKLIMCDCGYTNEEMSVLREKYSGIEFVWRLYLSKWNLRTDDEAFSVMIYASDTYEPLTTEDIKVLTYCTNLYALDLGHQDITDLTPIGEITTLRVLILADNKISDLTPLSNLKELQYLELFVNRVSDLSPLAACTELVDLNFGWNRVYDLSSIYSLPKIERLWLPTNNVPASARDSITAAFPEAQIVFEDVNSVSSGWRTHERYFSMRGMFNNNKYDENFVR